MIRMGLVGLGKMGISHASIINTHPDARLVAVCDSIKYVRDVFEKYTGIRCYEDFRRMFQEQELDGVIIATPSRYHAEAVRSALDQRINVFVEKPFCLSASEGEELSRLAQQHALVNQVGYHFRFVAAFAEAKRLVEAGAIGSVTHILAEAYGPVVLRPKGGTWRLKKAEGGGCLYDYACHAINIVNFILGMPTAVSGTVLNSIFSADTDDEVYTTLHFERGTSAHISAHWCDESQRKMTTKLTILGTKGRIYADRQECQAYLRDLDAAPDGYRIGWNVKYTTELTPEVWFYLRGEEYSAQLDYFVSAIRCKSAENVNSFESAVQTDLTVEMLISDMVAQRKENVPSGFGGGPAKRRKGFFARG
jgi:predicted dehydrogenase